MHEVVMKTAEPVSTREATERLLKALNSTYAKADLEHVATNTNHINSEKITQLQRLLKDFEDLFGGTLVDWDTDPTDIDLKTDYKPFNDGI